jgi:glycosyltransferase involved in cell wall biosynthesis
LRIAVIAPPWIPVPPVGYGGTETVIDILCRGLRAEGHDVLLVSSGDSECPVERRAVHPVALGTVTATAAAEIGHAAFGYEAAEAWGADIVHDHTLSGPALGAVSSKIPVVTTNHGPFTGDLAAVYRWISWHVPVIAISRSQAMTAAACRVAAVIHHGVDVDRYPEKRPGGDHVLFMGRMCHDKGVHVAIEVAHRAGVPLLIAAKMREPAEREYFDAYVAPHLGNGVEYVGEADRGAELELLGSASCLLNPIQWDEPFGMVAIEALAAGVPVVTTPRGAMPEIVEEGVSGFVRDTVEHLADAVWHATTLDPTACRRRAEECFSMQAMAANHARFYRLMHHAFHRQAGGSS